MVWKTKNMAPNTSTNKDMIWHITESDCKTIIWLIASPKVKIGPLCYIWFVVS